ncbi:Predicted DNA-binding transcriptional regulator YafY, contains an HTH and WYL domains [Sanguibacter gelidistatuariae]|uniref:Predicted DNA-binding transcriptional regulator YafY, contains an HTH and WYL domains n=1 Tax=Sanguibacter gelidistatuariae TaxID=1814289 RepID=A0A1G6S556_9MICO|nr:WYL domain-containing protein [Sanguibacter gelidistatuariae]SDD11794.1 Predicted DNA-binding transcriptional regulator YafY, contains an HTH and WYL domains [Sanguibacter gelidistatuariae]
MRADRLVATLLVLQARGRVSAAELAKELETSVSTARRDLEALSTAGIPVYPQPGRGGGWQLLGGARTDLSGLTSDEARALFLLVGPAAALDPGAKSALRKLVRALPETFRADAEAAAEAIMVDLAGWGAAPRDRPQYVNQLESAVVSRRRVCLTYTGWDKDPVDRLVDPWGLVRKGEVWYLLGATDGAERTYRVERITDLEITDQPAQRPPRGGLEAAWARVLDDVRGLRARASATVTVDAEVLPWLRSTFGPESIQQDTVIEGRARVVITAPTAEIIARGLVGWAERIDVHGPASVRAEIARLGSMAVDRNTPGGPAEG